MPFGQWERCGTPSMTEAPMYFIRELDITLMLMK
jgi:hypothetical protein